MEKELELLENSTKEGVRKVSVVTEASSGAQSPQDPRCRIGSLDECPDYMRETSHLKEGYRLNFNNCSMNLKR